MECLLESRDSGTIKFLVTTYNEESHPIFIFGLPARNAISYKLKAEGGRKVRRYTYILH